MNILLKLINLDRNKKEKIKFLYLILLSNLSLYIAFVLRYESFILESENHKFIFILNSISIILFSIFSKIHKNLFRFEQFNIYIKISIYFIFNSAFFIFIIQFYEITGVSRSAFLIQTIISVSLYILIRNLILRINDQLSITDHVTYNYLIYGAGLLGLKIFKLLKIQYPKSKFFFVDDDISKSGNLIDNAKVYDSSQISYLLNNFDIKEFIFGIQNIGIEEKNKILTNLSIYDVPIKSLPSISDYNNLKNLDDLKKIDDSDFFNNKIKISELTINYIKNKVVFVTGAGGSIGSEICSQLIKFKVKKLYAIDSSEINLYLLQEKLSQINTTQIQIDYFLVNLAQKDDLQDLENLNDIDIVYHAAAYKHVNILEKNTKSAIRNNLYSLINVLKIFSNQPIDKFILISSDKAVKPSNVMGFSKRICEILTYLESSKLKSKNTIYSSVRFGNVIGSSGSVIPKFLEQLNKGDPLTVSHKDANRYFMTIPDAVSLVIESTFISKNGKVQVLDMGKSINIFTLATKLLKFKGINMTNDQYIERKKIVFSGLKPGEKLDEEIFLNNSYKSDLNESILISDEFEKSNFDNFDVFVNDILNNLTKKNKEAYDIYINDKMKSLN